MVAAAADNRWAGPELLVELLVLGAEAVAEAPDAVWLTLGPGCEVRIAEGCELAAVLFPGSALTAPAFATLFRGNAVTAPAFAAESHPGDTVGQALGTKEQLQTVDCNWTP
jgi:hypothetical protein